jgi:hypothetical protein
MTAVNLILSSFSSKFIPFLNSIHGMNVPYRMAEVGGESAKVSEQKSPELLASTLLTYSCSIGETRKREILYRNVEGAEDGEEPRKDKGGCEEENSGGEGEEESGEESDDQMTEENQELNPISNAGHDEADYETNYFRSLQW